jgi:hypothetical protein
MASRTHAPHRGPRRERRQSATFRAKRVGRQLSAVERPRADHVCPDSASPSLQKRLTNSLKGALVGPALGTCGRSEADFCRSVYARGRSQFFVVEIQYRAVAYLHVFALRRQRGTRTKEGPAPVSPTYGSFASTNTTDTSILCFGSLRGAVKFIEAGNEIVLRVRAGTLPRAGEYFESKSVFVPTMRTATNALAF